MWRETYGDLRVRSTHLVTPTKTLLPPPAHAPSPSSSSCPRWDVLGARIALDVAEGLAYLHAQDPPLMHRDLKSPNVRVEYTAMWAGEERYYALHS